MQQGGKSQLKLSPISSITVQSNLDYPNFFSGPKLVTNIY